MKKAIEVAWKLINEHRELFDSISKEFAVEIIAFAIREQVKEALEEIKDVPATLEAAASYILQHGDLDKNATAISVLLLRNKALAIRKLIEEVE